MKGSYIDPTAVVKNSELKEVKLFRNARVIDSVLGDGCSVGDDTAIERCQFENNVVINRRSYINDCMIRRYSYTGINTTMNWTKMGAFCSVARNVDIGGFDHDYRKITTMPAFRFEQMRNGGGALQNHATHEHCTIGNDAWIAAGAIILHKVKIGDGAVIGAGAVVTHDIPPYAIAVGTPARVIGFRCKEDLIEDLLKVQWWNWPEETIRENMSMIIHEDISQETVQRLLEISNSISV